MMVSGVSICSVCGAGGVVSFSGVVGCRRAGGIGLVVGGGGRLAAVGWRGEAASCFQPSSCRLVALVTSYGK